MFDNRCLQLIARVDWCPCACNETVRKRVSCYVEETPIFGCIQHNNYRWLGHGLLIHSQRLQIKFLFTWSDSDWRNAKGGLSLGGGITWTL